jgi:hypothetical protein
MAGQKGKLITSKENKVEFINHKNGDFETKLTFSQTFAGKFINALGAGRFIGFDGFVDNFKGGALTFGLGIVGITVSGIYDKNTKRTTITVKGAAGGLGVDSKVVLDENYNVVSKDTDFGLQVIVGLKGEAYGVVSLGAKTSLKLGFNLKDGKLAVNSEGDVSVGLIALDGEATAQDQIEIIDVDDIVDDKPDTGLCFAAGTPVDMADGSKKPIEQIKIGDEVMAYDPFAENGRSGLSPKRVTQTHVTPNRIVIDFWGTKVTPGHVFLLGDGDAEGQHQMLMDIILDDGAVVRDDGTLIRAATGCEVGSRGDQWLGSDIFTTTRITPLARAKCGS